MAQGSAPTPTFHVTKGHQAKCRLPWLGIGADEDAGGPLAAMLQDMAIASDDRASVTSANEEPQSDPLLVTDPWARGLQR